MKSGWWGLAMGIMGGLLASGVILLVSRPPRGEAIPLVGPPSPHPITVHVTGAVLNPGIYHLAPGAHVHDAVAAAGGALEQADLQQINLAALLEDGQRIRVPSQGEAIDQPAASAEDAAQAAHTLVNINTASQEELETLPGIGPVTAARIIAHRESNGAFPNIEAIEQVPGIGPATFAKIKDWICVENP